MTIFQLLHLEFNVQVYGQCMFYKDIVKYQLCTNPLMNVWINVLLIRMWSKEINIFWDFFFFLSNEGTISIKMKVQNDQLLYAVSHLNADHFKSFVIYQYIF